MFRSNIRRILREEGINPDTYRSWKSEIKPRSYEELLKIYGLSEDLEEDNKNILNTRTYMFLAEKAYQELLEKIDEEDYIKLSENIYVIELSDGVKVQIKLGAPKLGIASNDEIENREAGSWSNLDKTIYIDSQVSKMSALKLSNEDFFKSRFIHEYTHFLTDSEDTLNPSQAYINKRTDLKGYYTQPCEVASYQTSFCVALCDYVKSLIKQGIGREELKDPKQLQEYIEELIGYAVEEKDHLFHDFLMNLKEKPELFEKFHQEVLENCVAYCYNHYTECVSHALENTLKEEVFEKYLKKEFPNKIIMRLPTIRRK